MVCMNKIVNPDNTRITDWVIWPHNDNFMDDIVLPSRECLIPYEMTHLSKYMYISGTYWVAKKEVMKEFPLDESLSWGESEDVEWSKKVRNKYSFSINSNSIVKTLKYKYNHFNLAKENILIKLEKVK